MTDIQNAVDRALLGLHLSEEDQRRALDWLAEQVGRARTSGEHCIDLPSAFNVDVARHAVEAGMVNYFWQSGETVRLYVTRGDQPVRGGTAEGRNELHAGPDCAA